MVSIFLFNTGAERTKIWAYLEVINGEEGQGVKAGSAKEREPGD